MKRILSIVFACSLGFVAAESTAQDAPKDKETLRKECQVKVGKKDTKSATDVAVKECVDKALIAQDQPKKK